MRRLRYEKANAYHKKYRGVPLSMSCGIDNTVQYNTMQHNATQQNRTQHNTVQCSTTQRDKI